MNKKKYIISLSLIFGFFFLRFFHLTILPIFADEAIYIRWSQIAWFDQNQRFIPLSDGKPPLQMWLMIPFWHLISDPLFAGRTLSIISGFVTTLGIFFFGKKLFNKDIGLLASFLYIVQPYSVFYDRLATADSMLSAFGIWSCYFIYKLFQKPKISSGIILGLIWGGALLTKPPAIYFILLAPLFILTTPTNKDSKYSILNTQYYSNWVSHIKKLLIPSIISSVIALAIYNILRLSAAFYMIKLRSIDYFRGSEEIKNSFFNYFFDTFRVLIEWLASYLTWPIMIIIITSLFSIIIFETINLFHKDRKSKLKQLISRFSHRLQLYNQSVYLFSWSQSSWKLLILFALIFAPIIVQAAIGKILYPRYTIFILPYILLILSWLFIAAFKLTWNRQSLKYGIGLTFGLMIFSWFRFDAFILFNPEKAPLHIAERVQYLEDWSAGYGLQDAAEFFKREGQDQKIVIGTEGYWVMKSTLEVYLEGSQSLKNIEFIGHAPTIGELDPKLKEAADSSIPTFLLINKSRLLNVDKRLVEIGETVRPRSTDPGKPEQKLMLYRVMPEVK